MTSGCWITEDDYRDAQLREHEEIIAAEIAERDRAAEELPFGMAYTERPSDRERAAHRKENA